MLWESSSFHLLLTRQNFAGNGTTLPSSNYALTGCELRISISPIINSGWFLQECLLITLWSPKQSWTSFIKMPLRFLSLKSAVWNIILNTGKPDCLSGTFCSLCCAAFLWWMGGSTPGLLTPRSTRSLLLDRLYVRLFLPKTRSASNSTYDLWLLLFSNSCSIYVSLELSSPLCRSTSPIFSSTTGFSPGLCMLVVDLVGELSKFLRGDVSTNGLSNFFLFISVINAF